MIGFDRPVKPEWIYETLKMVKVGAKPSIYNEPFENIAKELVGKEGKRKVRTIIFRSFIYSFQEKRTVIENNIFIEWTKQHSLDYLRPLFLAKLLMDYEITRFITKKIELSFDHTNQLSSAILSQKMIQEYGDREVVRHSVNDFLKTLIHFKIFERVKLREFRFIRKFHLSDEQAKDFLLLYAQVFLKSGVVDLSSIESSLLYFFEIKEIRELVKKYHGYIWEYIRDINRDIILISPKQKTELKSKL